MKTLKYILIAAVAVSAFSACVKEKTLSGIKAESMRIEYGFHGKVTAYPEPWDCTDYEFTYRCDNDEIVLVDEYGTISTEGLGKANITVSCGSYSVTVPVEVYTTIPEEIYAYSIGDKIQKEVSNGLTGLWEFNKRHAMEASVGEDLIPHYPDTKGSLGPVSNDGYTWTSGTHPFDGAILTKYSACFELTHGLENYRGTGFCVNYTCMIDAMRPSGSDNKYTTFFSYDLTNTADQYIYWRKDGIFQFGGGSWRSGAEYFSNDKWFRMVMVKYADMDNPGTNYMQVYANGELLKEWKGDDAPINGGMLYAGKALLNGDNDGDDAPLYFSTVAFWNRPLTAAEIKNLGEPSVY